MLLGDDGGDILDGGTGADVMDGGQGNDFFTVDDENDLIFENATSDLDTVMSRTIDVIMSRYENVERAQLFGKMALNVEGTQNADIIIGNGAANVLRGDLGEDTIDGGGGNDTIIGGLGSDVLTGGAGDDQFVFSAVPLVEKWAGRDHITDFTHLSDRIDLRGLMQDGSFIGKSAFSGAVEVRYVKSTGLIIADVTGDGVADWLLHLDNIPVLSADDFLF